MDLTAKKCVACQGGEKPLAPDEIKVYLNEVDRGWSLDGIRIVRIFKFRDFGKAMEFVNKVAEIAESEGHHPDMHIEGWNKVRIELYTHAIRGLHQNDFIVAAKIDRLEKSY